MCPPPAELPLARLQGLGKAFRSAAGDVHALRGVTADIGPGITGLVGPDGAGKTTLLRLLAGLLAPDTGSASVLGWDSVRDTRDIRALIGYMPQRFGLYEDLTVIENLRLYARLRALPKPLWAATFERLLGFTGLEHFTGRLAAKLSGGMKQKLGLACALIREPRLLLLDEPSVGVDPISRRELWRMVRALVADGIGVVWSTAYLDEAELCERVLLLYQGELLFDGVPADFTAQVAGRSFSLCDPTQDKRQLARRAMHDPEVLDVVIQGDALRIVTRQATLPPVVAAWEGQASVQPCAPRFEDAVIACLREQRGVRPDAQSSAMPLARARDHAGPPVRVENLCRDFGAFRAVDDVSFSLARGEVFGLIGPNGAGKSTVFKMLCGLLPPSAGRAEVVGIDLADSPAEARARLGYMAQRFSLYADLSALENLRFFAGAYGLDKRQSERAIREVSDYLELAPYWAMTAAELPLGFKQRLALACAVMHRPEILFLDEPTSGVDPLTRRDFWQRINDMVGQGVTVLVTTHFLEEAEYCDRIALIYRGRMIALGRPDEIKARCPQPAATLEEAFVQLVARFDQGGSDA